MGKRISSITKWLGNTQIRTIGDIWSLVEDDLPARAGPSAVCALEAALLDAFGKSTGASGPQLLGVSWPRRVRYSGIVPLLPLAALPSLLGRLGQFKFEDIKIKVSNNLPDSLERIRLVKNHFGENVRLRLDANCGWTLQEALLQIPALSEAGIQVFEQVFPPDREQDWVLVTAQFGHQTALMVDESVTTFESARRLLDLRIGNRFNLKISKQGGIRHALKIHQLAKSSGIACQLGAHYGETSILTTCGILFYAAAGGLAAMEGAFGRHLLTADICTTTLQFDQHACIALPESGMTPSGLGYAVAPVFLDKYSVGIS